MIDLLKAKEYFKKYSLGFDLEQVRIKLKMIHMYHVSENARKIAQALELPQEDVDLAELIGLLHDIGRFEQWKQYETYSDKLSIDHGIKGVEVLFGDKEIRNFIVDDTYDSIIFKAINNHNKLEIERGLTERELLHCRIVRDADNIDIFRVCQEEPPENFTHFGSKNVASEILTPEFAEEFKKEKPLIYANAKNDMDIMVAIMGHTFAIYFKESLKMLKDADYLYKFVENIHAQDGYTREKLNEIADFAMNFINKQIGEKY